MLTILHPFEELRQRLGRHKEKQQSFHEDQPSDQSDRYWQRPARFTEGATLVDGHCPEVCREERVRWSRLSEQIFCVNKWSVCRG
jgi:hypothetical protein